MWYLNPIFYMALIAIFISSLSLILQFWTKNDNKNRLFRDDYRKEINPLLDHFNNLMRPQSLYTNALWLTFGHDKLTGKRVLQHLLMGNCTSLSSCGLIKERVLQHSCRRRNFRIRVVV